MPDPRDDFRQARERQEKTLWEKADAARALRAEHGRSTASELAEDNNLTAGYIRQLIHTADKFPPGSRNDKLTFTHHKLAAMTEEPEKWIDLTVANGWKKRDLAEAIQLDPNETKRKKRTVRPTSGQPTQKPTTSDDG